LQNRTKVWFCLVFAVAESETKRLFVAIFPPAEVAGSLQQAIARLARNIPARAVRWTLPEQIHLTLHFLGSVTITSIPEIQSALAAACAGHRRYTVQVRGLGCFPDPTRPRIIWAGLAGDLKPVETLKKSIDAALLALGYLGEERAFHPHLTIGRVDQLNSTGRRQVAEALAKEEARDFGLWPMKKVELMQSVLSPRGAAYSALQSIPLDYS
jgi:2'-5' RNA ligase